MLPVSGNAVRSTPERSGAENNQKQENYGEKYQPGCGNRA